MALLAAALVSMMDASRRLVMETDVLGVDGRQGLWAPPVRLIRAEEPHYLADALPLRLTTLPSGSGSRH